MRTVRLNGWDCPCSVPRREKLAGHLNARLAEYGEEGIVSRMENSGVVWASFPGLSGQEAAEALERSGVFACCDGDGVRFVMGGETTFEDLDYVQAVAAGLL